MIGETRAAEVAYVDQSASGLALNLLQGPVDIEQFTVLRAGTLNLGHVNVRAAIIGASHVLTFQTPERTLTEVFACTGRRAGANRIFFGRLEHLLDDDTGVAFADGFTYRFRASFGDAAYVERLKGSLANGLDAIGMKFRFPPGNRDGAPPETVVSVRHTPTSIHAETAHSYRQEGKVVITVSELSWGPGVCVPR